MEIGTHVVVRTYSAGVHVGVLARQNGRIVELTDARRIWRWFGANTLNEVANNGVDADSSCISEPVARIELTEAIELIPTTETARRSLLVSGWKK